MTENKTIFKLPSPVLEEMLNYLAGRPYVEVVGLINKLTQLTVVEEPKNSPVFVPKSYDVFPESKDK